MPKTKKLLNHEEFKKEILSDPDVKAEYDALDQEFVIIDEFLKARHRAGLTQEEVAQRMGTKKPAIARLEAGGGKKRHSPSIDTLRRYADAVDHKLVIKMVPKRRDIEKRRITYKNSI